LLHPELLLAVDRRGGDERVDPWTAGGLDSGPGPLDVLGPSPAQRSDGRALHGLCDGPDTFIVTGAGGRKAGLDDVDTEPRQLLGDLDLFVDGERDPRCLLAVAQRRVEDDDAVVTCGWMGHCSCSLSDGR